MKIKRRKMVTRESLVFSGRELIELEPSPEEARPALIDGGIMGERERRITYGMPKHHKTNVALWEAFHIASGSDYLGYNVSQGRVLYIGFEGNIHKLKKRIKKMTANFPDECLDNMHLTVLVAKERDLMQIESLMPEFRPAITIIDPLGRLLRKEDKKEDVESTLNAFDRMIESYGTAIHLIHHANKGKQESLENMRGSTALPAWADTICRVARVNKLKDKVKLTWENRYAEEELEDMVLNFNRKECSFKEDITKVVGLQSQIISMLLQANASGKRLYLSEVIVALDDRASDRTISKAINSIEEIEVDFDEADRRKRYLKGDSNMLLRRGIPAGELN